MFASQLENGDENAKQYWELLNIFAYGTYADFKGTLSDRQCASSSNQRLT